LLHNTDLVKTVNTMMSPSDFVGVSRNNSPLWQLLDVEKPALISH